MASAGEEYERSISFHTKAHGTNIRIENNGRRAIRFESFDQGIVFSNRPIRKGEKVYLKVCHRAEDPRWLASCSIGFTSINPDRIQQTKIQMDISGGIGGICGSTYSTAIPQDLDLGVLFSIYFDTKGAFYCLDGQERVIASNINLNQPLWAVIQIRGNVSGMEFTEAPRTVDSTQDFFEKYKSKPDKLPIRYFNNLNLDNLKYQTFFSKHGPELDLFCGDTVVLRKNTKKLVKPYVFIDVKMVPNESFLFRVLLIDCNYRTKGIFGLTTAHKDDFLNIDKLPHSDPNALFDRPECWILTEELFDDTTDELDEYRIQLDQSGQLRVCRNGLQPINTRTLLTVDPNIIYYPFFYLDGRVRALSLIVPESVCIKPPVPNVEVKSANLCESCCSNEISWVHIPCGHAFFCSRCKEQYELKSAKICPICRQVYTEMIEIAGL